MRILLLEDEAPAARRIERLLAQVAPQHSLAATLRSIAEGEAWFAQNPAPDAILADIELADGRVFELLAQYPPQVPVIFQTAYDAHALEAFDHNGIAYLLKPVEEARLAAALHKVEQLSAGASRPSDGLAQLLAAQQSLLQQLAPQPAQAYRSRFLIRYGERFLPLETTAIASFLAQDKAVYALTQDGRRLPLDHTLDELERQLDPAHYFRLNRHLITGHGAVRQIFAHFNGRLKLTLHPETGEEVFVSRERVPAFKAWMGGGG